MRRGKEEIICPRMHFDSGPRPRLLLKETPRHVVGQPSHGPPVCSGLGILSIGFIFFLHARLPLYTPLSSIEFHSPRPAITELIVVDVDTPMDTEVIPVTMRIAANSSAPPRRPRAS